MNNTKEIVASEDLTNIVTKAFKLVRTGKSGFKKDGTGENGIPAEYLTSGKTLFVEPISRLYLGKGKGYRQTQYVVGASTHYVEDYYEDKDGNLVLDNVTPEQAKAKNYQMRIGLRSQGYNLREEYGRAIELGICFDSGIMNLGKFGDDPVLLKFIQEHEQNIAAPRAKENTDPKRIKLFTFAPMVKELDAAKSKTVENFDEDVEAMVLVQKMRTKTANGYTYNEDKLNAALTILEEGIGIGAGEVVQKFQIISKYARKDGATFLAIFNGVTAEYKMSIAIAEEMKVLEMTATDVKLLKDTKYESIYTFKSAKTKEDCIDELITYFIGNAAGKQDYNETVRLTEAAKIKAFSEK